MKKVILTCIGGLIGVIGCSPENTSHTGDFADFFSAQILKWGGKTNSLTKFDLPAEWEIHGEDTVGVAINVKVIDYKALTNALTAEFGEPNLYMKARPGRSELDTYRYPWTAAGVTIYVRKEKDRVLVDINRPIR